MRPMLRWFVFTVGFGLLPFAFPVLMSALETGSVWPVHRSPELLFFAVMVAGVQLGALLTEAPGAFGEVRADWLMWVNGFFLLMSIMAAGLYGVYVDRERNLDPVCRQGPHNSAETFSPVPPMAEIGNLDRCPEQVRFLENVFLFSVWLAAVFLALGTLAEWHRTRNSPWIPSAKSSSL